MLGRRAKRKNGQPGWLQKRKTALAVLAVFLFAAMLVGHARVAHAAVNVGLNFASATGLTTVDIRTFVGRIIQYFLGLLGIIAVSLMIYAGFIWMTAAGSEEKIKKAKAIITNAVIGLVIIVSAYAIVQFLFRALTGEGLGGTSGGPNPHLTALFSGNRGQDALGNGIIDYHYPEPGQTGVPRNTKISITFKKPLVLSTIFKHYDDGGTFTLADDHLCVGDPPCPGDPLVSSLTNPVFELNTANIKLIPTEGLAPAGSGTIDQQFNNRYPDTAAIVSPAPTAKVTPVTNPLDPLQYQTLVFKPATAIGSPSQDMNYRVALRGGDNGLKVWQPPSGGGDPQQAVAFSRTFADGGYYWTFTTSTLLDTTPPQIVAVVPVTTTDPLNPGAPPGTVLDRNQLLQIYFSKAIDPTTASGVIGTGGGFSNVEVKAQCLPSTYPSSCIFNGGNVGTVDGTIVLGNRYRTAEFTPSTECEGITENSCGEKVFCLPKNVSLTVRALAATIGTPPPAAVIDNGIEDMVGNSLDGNNDGAAQGPQTPVQPGGRTLDYYRNDPPIDPTIMSNTSDTARWVYRVGSNVDLVVPMVTSLDPPAAPPPSALYAPQPKHCSIHTGVGCTDLNLGDLCTNPADGVCIEAGSVATGPSNIPPTLSPSLKWSKTMSVTSMRTGGFDEQTSSFTPSTSTLVLRSKECAKQSADPCPGPPPSQCACTEVDPPGFFIDAGVPVESPPGSGKYITYTSFIHPTRAFYTANDLGYTDTDIVNYPDNIPIYAPIARAQMRDTKQNCFWPSVFKPTPGSTTCTLGANQYSCCEQVGSADGSLVTNCAP